MARVDLPGVLMESEDPGGKGRSARGTGGVRSGKDDLKWSISKPATGLAISCSWKKACNVFKLLALDKIAQPVLLYSLYKLCSSV